jgi:menaquinol-cytochrome c reductase iron-sulfur subunit
MAHDASGAGDGQPVDRRSFVGTLSLVLGGLVSLFGAAIAAVFAIGPTLTRTASDQAGACPTVPPAPQTGSPGPRLETIPVVMSSGWSEAHIKQAVYVDEAPDGNLRVFSARCPHEGCRIDWKAASNEFVCPCHDSRFTREGERVTGPTKRGMDPLPAKRNPDGTLEVCFKTFALDTPDRIEVG